MSKEKQIEEMAEYIFGNAITHDTQFKEDCRSIARDLYNAGYRKQSEVIDEFVKRLLDAFPENNRGNRCPAIYYDDYRYIIEELAEKMKGGAE